MVQVIGATVFGFILSVVTALLDTTSNREMAQKKRLADVRQWIDSRELPPGLEKSVWTHSAYTLSQKTIFNEAGILGGVPTRLKRQMVEEAYVNWIGSLQSRLCPFEREEQAFFHELVLQLRSQQIYEGHGQILEPWEPSSDVFFVQSGIIEGVLEQESRAMPFKRFASLPSAGSRSEANAVGNPDVPELLAAFFQTGEMFGVGPAIPMLHRMASRTSELLVLEKDALRTTLSHFPSAAERFQAFETARSAGLNEIFDLDEMVTVNDRDCQKYVLYYGTLTSPADIPASTVRRRGTVRISRSEDLHLEMKKPKSAGSGGAGSADSEPSALGRTYYRSGGGSRLGEKPLPTTKVRVSLGFDNDGDETLEEIDETEKAILSRWVIPPQHLNKVRWDISIGVLIMYSVIIIPYRIGFGVKADPGSAVFDVLVDICFALDMVLNFRTGFEDWDGIINIIPRHIVKQYLKGWFIIDFLSTFPIDRVVELFLADGAGAKTRAVKLIRIVRLARLLKLARMLKLGSVAKRFEEIAMVSPMAIKFLKLGGQLILLGHMLSCFWYYVALESDPELEQCASGCLNCVPGEMATTWYKVVGIAEDDRASQYATAFYWAFTTITTVGYGDITPTNDAERIYAMVCMIGGATVFGYISGSIAALASAESGVDAMIRKRVQEALDFCEEQNVCKRYEDAVKLHYNYVYQERSPFSESDLLFDLPNSLRKAVILHVHQEVIPLVGLFAPQHPPWFVASAVRLLEPQAFMRGEGICRPDIPCREAFFVVEGACEGYECPARGPLIVSDATDLTPKLPPDDTVRDAPPPAELSKTFPPRPPGSPQRLSDLFEDNGRALMQYEWNAGCVFGTEGLMDPDRRFLVRCCATSPCLCYVLKESTINDVVAGQPEFNAALQDALAELVCQQTLNRRPIVNAERRRRNSRGSEDMNPLEVVRRTISKKVAPEPEHMIVRESDVRENACSPVNDCNPQRISISPASRVAPWSPDEHKPIPPDIPPPGVIELRPVM